MRYNCIHCVANVLAGVALYHVRNGLSLLVLICLILCIDTSHDFTCMRLNYITPWQQKSNSSSCLLQEDVAIQVMDGVLEDIRVGMEVRAY